MVWIIYFIGTVYEMSLARFGVSIEEDLLKALVDFVIENRFPNRSQAI
jgi:metal-responsive CopG/Arc/MetJ family transcriptional regulator